MVDAQGGGRSGGGADEFILRTIAAHADSLLRTARRFSLCPDDAQDAYQRTLELFMAHVDGIDPRAVGGWLHVVVKREAQAISKSRQKLVGSDEADLDGYESPSTPTADERLASFDLMGRAAEALQRLKPQELRALWLKAQGHSYNEISALTGWSYTKVNRCLTEGRRSFLSRYATIESGAECRAWLPVISAMVDGEASADQLLELRPHLRNCPGCRATLKSLQDSAEPLAAVLPVPLVGTIAGGEEQLTSLLTRAYETVVGGFHDRAIYSFTKAQSVLEAASASKMAAVAAASAAAAAGGGLATAERKVPTPRHDKPAKATTQLPTRATRTPAAQQTTTQRPLVRKAPTTRPARSTGEFGRPIRKTKVQSPEFEPIRSQGAQFSRAAATAPPVGTPPASPPPPPRPSAPEFGQATPAPEFGG